MKGGPCFECVAQLDPAGIVAALSGFSSSVQMRNAARVVQLTWCRE